MPRVQNKNEKRAHSTLKAAPAGNMVMRNPNYGPASGQKMKNGGGGNQNADFNNA